MALSKDSRKLIESGNFEALEDQWLGRLSETPHDVAYFVGVGRSLGASGEEARAGDLLELVDDQLRADGEWELRLDLLQGTGPLLFGGKLAKVHKEILATLREIYAEGTSREGLIELVGLTRAPTDIPKTWQKVRRFSALIQFEVGSVVEMKGKGAGRVTEVNLELEKLKIDFENLPGLTVGLAAAGKLLEPLPEGHFLRRKLEDTEGMKKLAKENPGELLRALLTSQEAPMAAGAIKSTLVGLVGDSKWASWWSSARAHPQLLVSGKGARQTYSWAESSSAASDQVLDAFEAARDLAARLEIFRREAKRDDELKGAMAERLAAEGEALAADDPATALIVWSALERAGVAPDDTSWGPSALLSGSKDPAGWLPAVDDRMLRSSAASLIRKERGDWQTVYAHWLPKEEDPRVLTLLAAELSGDAGAVLETFIDDVMAHPRRHAYALAWLIESLESEDYLEGRNPLRLIQQTLAAPGHLETGPLKTRFNKAIEDGAALSHLLSKVEADQAERAEETLKRAVLEEYLRERLITQLHLQFPDLREVETDFLYALPASIDARRAELKDLLENEIPANRRAIEEARALGDLRENFEYKSARQRHEYLSARVSKLQGDLERVRPIDVASLTAEDVRVGTRATLAHGGETLLMTVLGPWESDPDRGVVSYETETAKRLLGKAVGEEIEVDGRTWRVSEINPAEPTA